MSFFADAGAWFDQAGKDAGQGFKDVTKAIFHDGPKDVMNEIATGDVMQGIWNAQDDFAQVVYDVFNPNNPDPNWVVDQIENTIDQQPTPDYITGPDFNEPAPALPSPITGPDFNEPAPALPSPGFKTFDPLTNPNPGLEVRAFEYGAVGVDALSIDSINDEESYGRTFEIYKEWLELGGGGGYGYMEDLRQQSIEYLLDERLQEAIDENPML